MQENAIGYHTAARRAQAATRQLKRGLWCASVGMVVHSRGLAVEAAWDPQCEAEVLTWQPRAAMTAPMTSNRHPTCDRAALTALPSDGLRASRRYATLWSCGVVGARDYSLNLRSKRP